MALRSRSRGTLPVAVIPLVFKILFQTLFRTSWLLARSFLNRFRFASTPESSTCALVRSLTDSWPAMLPKQEPA